MSFFPGLSRTLVAACVAASAAVAAGVTPLAQPAASAAPDTPLFVRYEAKTDCLVYPNYPKPGVTGQKLGWTIPKGATVIWRYNVNEIWSLVSDPTRGNKKFPWWGFTRRDCIGDSKEQSQYPAGIPVPDRVLEGRSKAIQEGWRPVDYHQGPETVIKKGVLVKKNGTMRERVNFVVGNVFAGWRVDVTNVTRSGGHWVYIYSPSARKWGYVEAEKLDL